MREAVRRKDREITDPKQIEEILQAGEAVCVAFSGGTPYVIPMNYGFACGGGRFILYLHGAKAGEKIERIKADPRAAFTVFVHNRVRGQGGMGCSWTTSFDSVCGSGVIRFLEGGEKLTALRAIMAHYAPDMEFEFAESMLDKTCAMALDVSAISGKHHD